MPLRDHQISVHVECHTLLAPEAVALLSLKHREVVGVFAGAALSRVLLPEECHEATLHENSLSVKLQFGLTWGAWHVYNRSMTRDNDRLERYAALMVPLLPLAKKAYGSRDTKSPQHDASREYTRLLAEYYNDGQGSLLDMAARLGVTYAGLRRRITTKDVEPSSHRARRKFPDEVYDAAVKQILEAKALGTYEYHLMLFNQYQAGLSMARIAEKMGLSSANPLYYGINKIKREKME